MSYQEEREALVFFAGVLVLLTLLEFGLGYLGSKYEWIDQQATYSNLQANPRTLDTTLQKVEAARGSLRTVVNLQDQIDVLKQVNNPENAVTLQKLMQDQDAAVSKFSRLRSEILTQAEAWKREGIQVPLKVQQFLQETQDV